MNKVFLFVLCIVQICSIVVIILYNDYTFNDSYVALDFIKRNAVICKARLDANDEDIGNEYDSLPHLYLMKCMDKLSEYEDFHLTTEFWMENDVDISILVDSFIKQHVKQKIDELEHKRDSFINEVSKIEDEALELEKNIVSHAKELFMLCFENHIKYVKDNFGIKNSDIDFEISGPDLGFNDVECIVRANISTYSDEAELSLELEKTFTNEHIPDMSSLLSLYNTRDTLNEKIDDISDLSRELNHKIELAKRKVSEHLVAFCKNDDIKKIIDNTLF